MNDVVFKHLPPPDVHQLPVSSSVSTHVRVLSPTSRCTVLFFTLSSDVVHVRDQRIVHRNNYLENGNEKKKSSQTAILS